MTTVIEVNNLHRTWMTAMPLTYLGDSPRQTMVDSSALHSHLIIMAVLGGRFLPVR